MNLHSDLPLLQLKTPKKDIPLIRQNYLLELLVDQLQLDIKSPGYLKSIGVEIATLKIIQVPNHLLLLLDHLSPTRSPFDTINMIGIYLVLSILLNLLSSIKDVLL